MEAYITINSGEREGILITLRCPATIGRASGCDLRLTEDKSVSSRHARIFIKDSFHAIEDLHTRNGTLVNGRPVRIHFLKSGDVIQVGDTMLRFSLSDSATERRMDGELADQVEAASETDRSGLKVGFSKTAIGAALCGLGAFGPWPQLAVFSLAAIILGIISLAEIRRGASRGLPLAAAGLLLGLGTGVYHLRDIAFLPYVYHKREMACRDNLRQIHDSLTKYRTDNAGRYPPSLLELAPTYLRDSSALRCPSSKDAGVLAEYVYLASGRRDSDRVLPVAADPDSAAHGKPGGNVLYSDGHIQWIPAEEMAGILEQFAPSEQSP
ncbi:MAG TPA: FHA domain-containing protein [Candidatus Brocadiia bacterium]|nr:FHA domain-containing protein [Candidatus Brocadiia bacterium]